MKSANLCFFMLLLIIPSMAFCQITFIENDYYTVLYNINNARSTDTNDVKKYFIPAETEICILQVAGNIITIKIDNIYSLTDSLKDVNCVAIKKLYTFDVRTTYKYYFRHRHGWRGGIATTPFKYRPEKGTIFPGGNLAFAGAYFFNLGAAEISIVGFAGFTTVSLNQSNNKDIENRSGFTYGSGISINVFERVEIGAIAGWDWVSKDWDSNNRIWYGFSFGYRIIN